MRIGTQNLGSVTTDDVKWINNMGNARTRVSTHPYMVDNKFEDIDQDLHLTSTLTITNVNTQHAGLYQFILSINDSDVMSRKATLSVLKGNSKFIFTFCSCGNDHRRSMCISFEFTLITIL